MQTRVKINICWLPLWLYVCLGSCCRYAQAAIRILQIFPIVALNTKSKKNQYNNSST